MTLAPVRAVPYPNESKLRSLYKSAYFIDAFVVPLPSQGTKEYRPDALARALFGAQPVWFSMLMWIRDWVMSVFGVKSSTAIQAEAEKKGVETISIFPVISRTENEIVMGENDRHLNFQTSLLIRETQLSVAGGGEGDTRGKELVAITVVHCHGLLGKAYITIIKPFHVMIVRYGLARLPNRIGTKDD